MGLVRLENIDKNYRVGEVEVEALREVSVEIGKGAFVSFIGPSGSGKTTLLNIIGCLDKPSRGRAEVAGQEISGFSRRRAAEFRGENIGFVFQSFNLLPVLTVAENVEYPLVMVKKIAAAERKRLVKQMLEVVGLADQAGKYPDAISGGQKQRVAVARALVTKPELVLADEPTANLDHATAGVVMNLMKRLRNEFGTTFIFSTHDPRIIDQVDAKFTLLDGRLTNNGSETGEYHV
ncbi:MAG: ABC transporter ATP-binding protein [Thermodesulfobacteriota bacterium]